MALLYVLAALLLAGGIALAFTHPFGLPTADWLQANPGPAIGLALVTGFADGINPCAIATLLLFVGALLAVAEATTRREDARRARLTMLAVAGAYIAGIFVLYYALGAGFINATSLRVFGNTHVFTRLAGLLAVLLGLGMIAEIALPGSGIRIAMPSPSTAPPASGDAAPASAAPSSAASSSAPAPSPAAARCTSPSPPSSAPSPASPTPTAS